MRKKWKNLVRIVLLVVAGAVLGVNLYSWNAKSLMGNSLPMPFGCGVAVVLSGSMEPTIRIDDLIIVTEQEDYRENDIVAYQSGSMVVVHRIIQVEPDTVITQGDANNAPDAPIRKEMIKGKVVHWIPGAGRIARLLKSPVATVILVGGALLLSELTLRKEKKKDEDELEQIKAEIRRLKAEQE
jgi:signal peptidase